MYVDGICERSRVSVVCSACQCVAGKIIKTRWNETNVDVEAGRKRRKGMSMTGTVQEHVFGLYSAFDNDLAVFLLEHPRKHRHSWFTIKGFLLIGAVWVCEEGALVVHEEVTRFGEAIKYKLLVDEGQRQSLVSGCETVVSKRA